MSIPVKKGSCFFIFTVVLYRLLLDWSYDAVISEVWLYAGFISNPDAVSVLLSWIFLAVITGFSLDFFFDEYRISAKVMLVLFLLSAVPFTTLVAHRLCTMQFAFWNFLYFVLLFGSYHILVHCKPVEVRIWKQPERDTVLKGITILFAIVILYVSGHYTGFRFNFSLSNVYELRAEAAQHSMSTLLSYLFSWSRALIPVCLGIFVHKKKPDMVLLCIIAQLLSFGFDGSKTPLFLAILAVIINILPRVIAEQINKYILIGVSAVVGLSLLIYLIFGNYIPCGYITRRVLFLPVQLETNYFDYFLDRTPDFFRASFLRHLGFQTPYPDLDNIIGAVYYNQPDMNCNSGLLSDAVSNLGYLGIVCMPLVLSFVLVLLDKCSRGLDPRIYLTTSLSIAMTLINTNLFTALLTHGILMLMLLLAVTGRDCIPALTEESERGGYS